jgi:FlaA1/EpsC-like NDP-sugar epimerase
MYGFRRKNNTGNIMIKRDRVFITGITGSLGRAFVDLLKDDYKISGIDHNENNVAKFHYDYPDLLISYGDFTVADLTEQDVLIHLAAMKHIDLCEKNAMQCVINNVIKPVELFKHAKEKQTKILFMSTDKAVEPCSNYGYTKALMESVVLELGGSFARSGNIMASNGSVMKIWDEALEKNEPIRITHRDMRRYFVSPEHLAERIWEKFLAGEKTIIPEMDDNISLYDLARHKIRRAGKDVETYPIKFIGLRPGEKLEESLVWEREK